MGYWSAETSKGRVDDLTIYQLQELVRAGVVESTTRVTFQDITREASAVPQLLALFEQRDKPTALIGGIELQVGARGRPVLPRGFEVRGTLEQDFTPWWRKWRLNRWRVSARTISFVFLIAYFIAIHWMFQRKVERDRMRMSGQLHRAR